MTFAAAKDPSGTRLPPLAAQVKRLVPGYVLLLISSFFILACRLVPAFYIIQIGDRVWLSRSLTTLTALTILVVAILALGVALEHLRVKTLQRMSIEFDLSLGRQVLERIYRASSNQSVNNALVVNDFNTVRNAVGGQSVVCILDLIVSPAFILALFIIHPLFGVFGLVLSLLVSSLYLVNHFASRETARRAQQAAQHELEFTSALGRNTDAMRALGMLSGIIRRWQRIHLNLVGWQSHLRDRILVVQSAIRLAHYVQYPALMALATILYFQREISIGTIIAATMIAARCLSPIEQLFANWRTIQDARASYSRLIELLHVEDPERRMQLPRPKGELRLASVSYRTPRPRPKVLLNDVSFQLASGRTLGVVGQSGAGKSTLARLMVGAWPATQGAVTLDGHELSHWDPDDLGHYVGYVPQDIELLPGSVAENISRFRELDEDGFQAVIEAAKLAEVEDLIKSLPDGYNTKVGPRGQDLSGGQRQRLAIARAVFGNPAFVVLDEPNSNLDAGAEEALGRTILALRAKGTTVVLITHKLNMLVYCDEILVLNDGVLHIYGSREEIVRRLPIHRLSSLRPVGAAG